ncbi:hypothetical protein NARC_200040 [Candidatus Nitrosocosmicus arcticus]|uniref:Uncharacterized protein n=1 Tax=Candidatus Nitrosocosmicus arcticus TaxID=2035267 RepID=A0A557SRC5_9ARCH|nr:hypothetical protein NARC_200040 [Candidatus Nitrosocosmicus arcticus]
MSFRNLIKLGINIRFIRKAIIDAITVPITNSSKLGKNNYSIIDYLYI